LGYQIQNEARTVQYELVKAIEKINGEKTKVDASGRTDKGVHAIEQHACFKSNRNMQESEFKKALNGLLPDDIVVKDVLFENDDFHPRFSVKNKTYMYKVKKLPTENCFFFVDRSVFGQLNPRQMMIYLFICKSYNTQICDCWNSYADISAQTGMKRETVIQTISELEALKLIRKSKRKSRDNRRVYVDNHYILILYVKGTFKGRKRKAVVPLLQPQFNVKSHKSNTCKLEVVYCNSSIPQELKKVKSFFINFLKRGSPQI
jgi:tRNA U38,U39,U40 pseudouridine synthase TruA